MNDPRTPTRQLAACLLLVVAALGVGAADAQLGPAPFIVPEGTTVEIAGPIEAGIVRIDGTVTQVGGGALVLRGESIDVGPAARIQAAHGLPGAHAAELVALATPGGAGASVMLDAPEIRIAEGAIVLAGAGGSGGNALGHVVASAGRGGDGGSVELRGASLDIAGDLIPGAGGGGGHALISGWTGGLIGRATGGEGGASGTVLIDGLAGPLPASQVTAPASAIAVPAEICVPSDLLSPLDEDPPIDVDIRDLTVTAPCVTIPPVDTDKLRQLLEDCGLAVEPATTRSSDSALDCGAIVELVKSVPKKVRDRIDDLSDCATGADSAPAADTGGADLFERMCEYGLVDVIVDSVAGLRPGTPGSPGTPEGGCQKPAGEKGKDNVMGAGGDGGDACVDNSGGDGSDGANGASGPLSCGNGGPGGNGGNGLAANAVAGHGGHGLTNGGHGGNAEAYATGGTGGDGGDGGQAWFYKCAGGNGGNGGNGADATATGGNGGMGLCGAGGEGGLATAEAYGGDGGSGGSGTPAGLSGLPGQGGAATAKAGEGGLGANVCPKDL